MLLILLLLPFLVSCTVSLSNANSRDNGSDLIDEQQSTDVKPTLQIPLKP